MTAKMTCGASSSSSSSSRWNYDVFLNFYGKDTRKNFTSHLFTALVQKGIRTFKDDEELKRGEDISSELMDAIEGSKIAIVVFSENYASSIWCLNELVKILDCKKKGQTVLPVFYKVDPVNVRQQKRSFAEAFKRHEKHFKKEMGKVETLKIILAKAFARHEEHFKEEMGKVETWKAALTEAANLSGWDQLHVADGHESKLIMKIIEEVLTIVNQTHLHIAAYPIGLDPHIKCINCLLNDRLDVVRVVGIHGLGGIGKTTIAKAVFNAMFQKFEGSSFLANVREVSSQQNGLALLQAQLLSDVLKAENIDISNEDRGIIIIKERLSYKRVLIVLDDVDKTKQFDKLAGRHEWFGPGSRIIITTRDEHLLNRPEVDGKYKVKTMDPNESLQLFSCHAFRENHPLEDYVKLSNDVVNYARGLPLALVILGSLLLDKRSQAEWESELEKLRKIPNGEILEILQISYDALDDFNRTIFLDIACFFTGKEIHEAIEFMDGCGLCPTIGIRLLIERSLLTVDDFNCFRMHDLIQDMGREIVRKESPRNLGERSRLWLNEDAFDVLANLTILSKLKILDLSFSSNLIRTPDFSGLPNLEKLLLYGCKRLVEVHENIDHLSKLVHLNLTSCVSLGNLPSGISKLVSLESLGICYCLKLEKLPAGIGNLTRLRSLDAFRTAIEELPSSINLLKDLTTFKYFVPSGQRNPKSIALLSASLYGWYSLNRLQLTNCHLMDVDIPDDLWKLCCLKSLDLSGNDFCSLPSGICDQLSELETLRLNYCKSLQSLPRLPSSLCFLEASNCISLERLPNLSNLKHLKKLKLSGCSKLKEIEALGSLESGEEIDLYYCDNLDKSRIFQEISKEFRNRDVCQISLSESEIPEWFEFQNEQPSSSASCQVTILHNMEIRGVIICIVLPSSDYDSHEVVVHNQSKNSTLNRLIFLDYIARPSGVFDEQLSVMKIPYCVWKSIAGFGDVINVSVRKTWGDELSVVNKIGVHLFHTQHEKVSNQGNSEAT